MTAGPQGTLWGCIPGGGGVELEGTIVIAALKTQVPNF